MSMKPTGLTVSFVSISTAIGLSLSHKIVFTVLLVSNFSSSLPFTSYRWILFAERVLFNKLKQLLIVCIIKWRGRVVYTIWNERRRKKYILEIHLKIIIFDKSVDSTAYGLHNFRVIQGLLTNKKKSFFVVVFAVRCF